MSLKFALAGCGRIGKRHAEQIIKHGILVAVCDCIPGKADEMAALYHSKAFYSIEDLLENEKSLDVVSICTPNGLHAQHSIAALKAGSNVLCEKPLCINVEDGRMMMKTALKMGKKIFVVF